jgi:hypothetical protein
MRVLYVAKHGSGDNDDEGAIAHALRRLGHEVDLVQELRRRRVGSAPIESCLHGPAHDFCLFHKWETVSEIYAVSARMPCVFWYFDLVANHDDPTLSRRMETRRRWFADVVPLCVAGFCTDGDWVTEWNRPAPRGPQTPRLYWLMQGMDERVAGLGVSSPAKVWPNVGAPWPEILFTGMIDHGRKRREHVGQLRARYGDRFMVYGDGETYHRRLHGRALADLFASVPVIVAPDGPCTDRYWSNRVYLTLGLGGFLLHPHCAGLNAHYGASELISYTSRDRLVELIDSFLDKPQARDQYRRAGLKATIDRNLYRHRVAELVEVVRGLS